LKLATNDESLRVVSTGPVVFHGTWEFETDSGPSQEEKKNPQGSATKANKAIQQIHVLRAPPVDSEAGRPENPPVC